MATYTVGRVADFLGYTERQVRDLITELQPFGFDRYATNPDEPLSRAILIDMVATRTGGTRTANKLAQLLSETR